MPCLAYAASAPVSTSATSAPMDAQFVILTNFVASKPLLFLPPGPTSGSAQLRMGTSWQPDATPEAANSTVIIQTGEPCATKQNTIVSSPSVKPCLPSAERLTKNSR